MALMDELTSDQEKAEELKAWWRTHGVSVVSGIALAVAALFGYEYWQKYKTSHTEEASAIYSQIQNDPSGLVPEDLLKKLQANYTGTSYAVLASLDEARSYAEVGQYDRAIQPLRWVIDNAKQEAYKPIAQLRLARVYVAQSKFDEATKIIDGTFPSSYQGLVEEIRGDIFATQKQFDKARAAYEKAMLNTNGQDNQLIRLKLDNLGVPAPKAS